MIHQEIEQRLIAEWGFERRDAAGATKLVRGRCPVCGEPEAFTPPDNPFVVCCPRKNKCAVKTHVKSLYPDLFNQFARHHPNTAASPRATQDAYLRSRGLDPVVCRDWWEPDTTTDPDDKRRSYPTVRFTLANGVAYHRLVDYAGRNKNKVVAAYQGSFWGPPRDVWRGGDLRKSELWICEGVLDAVSLLQAGLAAVANISSGHVPSALMEQIGERRVTLVIAQDNDRAGRAGADKLARECAERGLAYRLAFPPEGADWNDLLVRGDLAPERVTDTLDRADWRGKLHQAPTALDFFKEWKIRERNPLFAWRGETYVARNGKGEESLTVSRVADFTAERLYRLRLEPVADRPEYSEVVRVHRDGDEPHEVMLSGSALSRNQSFREALFTQASAQWDGLMPDLNAMLHHLRSRPAPTVRQVEVWGYDRKADSYFFPGAAYGPQGKRIEPNERGIVAMRRDHMRLNFRLPRLQEDEIFFWVAPEGDLDMAQVVGLLADMPHGFGLAGLGFFTATLFAHQVAEKLGMFPFLSLYGETHTGKSTLLRILHRLLGREWEGMPVNEANTKVGQSRYIAAYSNMPVALIEADAHERVQVEGIMNLRTAYNRGAIRVTGIKSADNTLRATPFRGGLVFGWNEEKLEDAKVKERMVSLRFAQADNSEAKLAALNALENIPPPAMARYLDAVLTGREAVLATLLELLPQYEARFIKAGVEITRTAQNHAVPMAGLSSALKHLFPAATAVGVKDLLRAAFDGLLEAAKRKERELNDDPDDVQLFFQRVGEWLTDGRHRPPDHTPSLTNYSRKEGEIAISMVQFEDRCAAKHLQFHKTAIFKALRRSRHFIRGNHPYRLEDGSQVKCWSFSADALT